MPVRSTTKNNAHTRRQGVSARRTPTVNMRLACSSVSPVCRARRQGNTTASRGATARDAQGEWDLRDATAAGKARAPCQNEATTKIAVVLVEPQIPGNTGAIARTCASQKVDLHLVRPLGFELDDTKLKRAGLDYWQHVCVAVHDNWDQFREMYDKWPEPKRLVSFTTKADYLLFDEPGATFRDGDVLLFGAEDAGLPEHIRAQSDLCLRIPMEEQPHVRSLNLSVSVAVGVFEAVRQSKQNN